MPNKTVRFPGVLGGRKPASLRCPAQVGPAAEPLNVTVGEERVLVQKAGGWEDNFEICCEKRFFLYRFP